MQEDLTAAFRSLLAGKITLTRRIEELQSTYQTAKPFPHVVIDHMFAPEVLDALLAEMTGMGRDKWKRVDNDSRERTLRMKSAAEMGPAGAQLLSIVHSAGFLYFLSEITGIPQLLPDPYLLGSGYAQMRRGDYFSVHSDRNVAYDTGMLRRLPQQVMAPGLPRQTGIVESRGDEVRRDHRAAVQQNHHFRSGRSELPRRSRAIGLSIRPLAPVVHSLLSHGRHAGSAARQAAHIAVRPAYAWNEPGDAASNRS
jgi:hypothetical protein